MDLRTLQHNVDLFVKESGLEAPVQSRLLDLVSEVGELSKEVLKATNYGHEPFVPRREWADEVGDVLFSLICLSNSTEVNLEEALQGALDKYRQRLGFRGDAGSGR